MSPLVKWTWARPLRAIEEALVRAGVSSGAGPLAVVDAPQAAFLLAASRPVLALGAAVRGRAARRFGGRALRATAALLPLADGSLAALVGTGGADATVLSEWSRAVRHGGVLVLVDRVAAEEHTRRALCAGLVDLEQRTAGRLTITSGRVHRWA